MRGGCCRAFKMNLRQATRLALSLSRLACHGHGISVLFLAENYPEGFPLYAF